MRFIGLLLIPFAFSFGCNKPDPQPWVKDPIYQDMQAKKKEIEARLAGAVEQGKKFEEMLARATPQTGQEKNARGKVENQRQIIEKIRQELEQYKFALESRVEQTQRDYMKAFLEKKPWPNPEEFESYKVREKLASRSRTWKVSERIKESKARSEAPKPSSH